MRSARGKNAWQQLPTSPRGPAPGPSPASSTRSRPPPQLQPSSAADHPASPRWATTVIPSFRSFRVEPHTPTATTPIVAAVVAPDSVSVALSDDPIEDHRSPSLEEALAKSFADLGVKGEVAMEVLPIVLANAGITAEATAVDEAIYRIVPGAEHSSDVVVTFALALAVAQYLTGAEDKTHASVSSAGAAEEIRDSASLTKLLASVIGIMFLCASLAVGLAILWLWLNTVSQDEHYARIELKLNSDMLDVMVHRHNQQQKEKLAQDFAETVGTLLQNMGFELSSGLGMQSFSLTAKFLARVIDEWWQREGVQAVNDTATLLKLWVRRLFDTVGVNETARLLYLLNQQVLPPGYEVFLGQWSNGNNSAIRYLFPRRFTDQCLNGVCNSVPGSGLPLRMALWGYEGVVRGLDYRPKMVQAGYRLFTDLQIGMVFKVDLDLMLDTFCATLKSVFDAFNLRSTDTSQILLARNLSDGTQRILTDLTCAPDTDCYQRYAASLAGDATPLARGLRNQQGLLEVTDYDGDPVIAAYIGVPSVGLGLVVKISDFNFIGSILSTVGAVLPTVNARLPGSAEVELASYTTDSSGNLVLSNLSAYKSPDQCAGPCAVSPYLTAVARACSSGVTSGVDYRGVNVLAGYTCLPELSTVATYKVDQREIAAQGLAQAVQATDLMNRNEVTSFEMLLGQPKGGMSPDAVKADDDVQILTKLKSDGQGVAASGMAPAFRGFEGILYTQDYRGVGVMAAVGYLSSMGLGMEGKLDRSELLAPIVSKALVLIGINLGCLLVSTVLLALYTRKMVLSMVRAEREGQEAIRVEKQRFGSLVESMYPTYVVPRLLAGERSIVQSLPHTAVFFSDIYDFTSTANKISSEELLDLMGYTYGVMDKVADQFCVTKVKTVGDAYLAISGLPGHEGRNCALDMLRFASCVAQVFSCKFDHPSRGDVLALLQSQPVKDKTRQSKSTNGKSSSAVDVKRHSVAVSVSNGAVRKDGRKLSTSSQAVAKPATKDPYAKGPKVRCLMSYGIAAGPVTAGVLQGKNPMFDIWGKTVNLASRMQSTGQPGRIQVSDLFHRSVVASPDQPFLFEDSHQVMCKGFGTVTSYFVKGTSETPPKALLAGLGLRPNLGLYFFENLVPGYRKAPTSGAVGARPGPGEGAGAPKAPALPGGKAAVGVVPVNPRGPPKVEPLALLELEDL